ncbi:cupin domain-containing protein [Kitasatospora sp. NPDC052896]|uniref:cupin domain-containing protein n=1 Tax=Kitasatospora sp. NPDC052896 TaxID=3364061 RepID=UPI0037C7B670
MEHLPFETCELAEAPTVTAPDGALVRVLAGLPGAASFAQFELAPGAVSHPVSHATVQEIWYVAEGSGQLWRRQDGRESSIPLRPGTSASIPLGTAFQFRADGVGTGPLRIVAVTVPPWPNSPDEARPEDGPWTPTVPAG